MGTVNHQRIIGKDMNNITAFPVKPPPLNPKPQVALVRFQGGGSKMIMVDFEAVRNEGPIVYKGRAYVYYCAYAISDKMHDDPNYDWRANVAYQEMPMTIEIPDDAPEVKE